MADFRNYDPGKIVCSFKGVQILGFMDGTMVLGERSEDSFETAVGSQGDVARVRKRNKSGQVTFTLQQVSPTNALLSAIAELDEEFGTGVGALFVKDLNGADLMVADNAWIQKPPNMENGDTLSSREWIIACAEIRLFSGGALL